VITEIQDGDLMNWGPSFKSLCDSLFTSAVTLRETIRFDLARKRTALKYVHKGPGRPRKQADNIS
jgi:hypothetical protein